MKSYTEIAGDGGSGVAEQVGRRREALEHNLRGVRHLVAVGSGKGGVGKSTLTALLAGAMQAQGRRAAVLDADLNGPAQARLGGVRAAPLVPDEAGRLPLARAAAGHGVVSLGAIVPEREAVGFEPGRPGDSHLWRATREFTFLTELFVAVQWGELDFLLVDLPPGAERTFQHAELLGDRLSLLLVTLPSGLSRSAVARSVSALRRSSSRVLGYVENMTEYYCAGCDALRPLFARDDAVELGVPRLGSVPFDPALAAACDRGLAQVAGPVAHAVIDVAARVAAALEGQDRR